MNDQQLESFLRENRPQTEKDPTFILETRRRMEQVEGIKAEVDRTRRTGRVALIAALVSGLVVGSIATAAAFLFPIKAELAGSGVVDTVRVFLDTYKQYLVPVLAMLIVALSLVLSLGRRPAAQI